MLTVPFVTPLEFTASGELSQFSDRDTYDRPDLRPGTPIMILGVNSIDWVTSSRPQDKPVTDLPIIASMVLSYRERDTDTWVEYCPQSGPTAGDIVQCNLRELRVEQFDQVIEKVGEAFALMGANRHAMAQQFRQSKENRT